MFGVNLEGGMVRVRWPGEAVWRVAVPGEASQVGVLVRAIC